MSESLHLNYRIKHDTASELMKGNTTLEGLIQKPS